MFYVGQKVVCVNAEYGVGQWFGSERPVNGNIYTITRSFIDAEGDHIVWLFEIARGPEARKKWGNDAGYGAYRFRPLTERKTDISIFKRMLTPKRESIDA